jgi:ribosomal-protein-alanine N-acetyltransferase
MRLTSLRTTLRPLTRDDIDIMHALWTDPAVRKFLWDDIVIARERAVEVVEASEADFAARQYGLWAVIDKESDGIAGFCGLRSSEHSWSHACPELLYGLWPRFCGKGLATEAARAVLSYAFALGHREVVAATDVPNTASVRVLERLGMTLERRDVLNGLDTLFYRLSSNRGAP